MGKTRFKFVSSDVLRANLNTTFDHLTVLYESSNNQDYSETQRSSFRKTVIIYTAAIIEALLLEKIRSNFTEAKLATECWELKNKKVLHKVDDTHKIVAGDYVLDKKILKFDKLNLSQINALAKERKFVSPQLSKKVDKVRDLRNKQHIGMHANIERGYSKADLEFVFSVAKNVKDLFNKKS